MPWITTKDGRHVNTDWFDERDRQIAANKEQADKMKEAELPEDVVNHSNTRCDWDTLDYK